MVMMVSAWHNILLTRFFLSARQTQLITILKYILFKFIIQLKVNLKQITYIKLKFVTQEFVK